MLVSFLSGLSSDDSETPVTLSSVERSVGSEYSPFGHQLEADLDDLVKRFANLPLESIRYGGGSAKSPTTLP